MNGSHEVRIVDLASGEAHVGDIELPGSSPRYMAVDEVSRRGYISSWTLGALITIDMDTHALVDTFYVQGLPEQILIVDEEMFVSIPMQSDWTASNEVVRIATIDNELAVTQVYEVIEGPGALTYHDGVYVSSIYYNDAWETFTGTSKIDETNGTVITMDHGSYSNYTADFDLIGNSGAVYRTYGNSLVPLNSDLSLDTGNAIGDISGIYSHFADHISGKIFIGSTDFVAPDVVTVLSGNDQSELASFSVGALPSQIIYHFTEPVSSIGDEEVPETMLLGSNYPNPFNPRTTIPFHLNHSGQTHLDIYDIRGKRVRTLIDAVLHRGDYSVQWDGLDESGSLTSSGIYHVVLSTPDEIQDIKVTLLR